MITISKTICKTFSQETYNKMINSLPFHKLTCTCGRKASFIKHAYYCRSFKFNGHLIRLKVLRLICKSCNKTHSVLPDWIVPYSRTLLIDQVRIIKAYHSKTSYDDIMINNLLLDESNLNYIIKNYLKHWKERLLSYSIPINKSLITSCFKYFKRQFMQIKRTANILFSITHIR